jgi:hypothetical protein
LGKIKEMLESKSWSTFLVRLLITIFGIFIGASVGQIFVIQYHIDYANVLGALGSGSILGTYLLGPFINEALTERAKKIEQEREHYLKGLNSVMTYAARYYIPMYRYAFSSAFLLENAKEEQDFKYAFFWLGKTFQKRSDFYFKAGGVIKLQDLIEELTSEILFKMGRDCLPFDHYQLTCLIKYTIEQSKISPLFFDFLSDLDNKNAEINKVYVNFKKWLTSPDTRVKLKDSIRYLNCFASHMGWQLNQMYSGWYQKSLSTVLPEDCQKLIKNIKETIKKYEKEGRSRIYKELGIIYL